MPRVHHDPLTDAQVRALAPGAKPIDVRDGELRGLVVTVLPSGRKQFTVRYRYRGTQRRFLVGEYPGISLAKARKLARAAQTAIDHGDDPVGDRQIAKAKRTDTIATLAADYLRLHARKFKRSADEDERILNVEVLPRWHDRSVRELTRRDVRALIERIAERAPVMANRVLAVVRKMLNFAVDHDWIDANPAARVKKPAPEASRDRVLTADEIRRLWRLLSHFPTTTERPAPGRKRAQGKTDDPLCPVSPWLAAALKVRLLTAQRGGEVARMRWSDLELERSKDGKITCGWWTIPGEFTKNSEPHRVPITAEVAAIVAGQEPKEGDERGTYVFARDGGAAAVDRSKKASAALARVLGIDFRGHDLRRTAATGMAESGVPREHISRVLNHVEGGARATRIYDRHTYDNEKRIALETWERRLRAILSEKPTPAGVVSLAR
jgi:integrase